MTSDDPTYPASLSSPEVVRAYVDGELEDAARRRLEAALPHDAALQAAVKREQRLRTALGAAYAPVLDEPVPDALRVLLQPPLRGPAAAAAAPLTAVRVAANDAAGGRWGALAACLVGGVLAGVLGHSLWTGPASNAVLAQAHDGGPATAGGLLLQGAVAQVLSQQLASEQTGQPSLTVGWSFQARDGGYCRTFTTSAPEAMAGLACRTPQGWQLKALAPAEPVAADPAAMRTAASGLPTAVLQAAEALRQGDALDAQAEAAARVRDWRP